MFKIDAQILGYDAAGNPNIHVDIQEEPLLQSAWLGNYVEEQMQKARDCCMANWAKERLIAKITKGLNR